ncbi:MAG TPA: O-antigen ligase family protein, partial [Chloroflexota bacterium]|nr:O-antigen ligase family protein [Chloroflexota bacterium]
IVVFWRPGQDDFATVKATILVLAAVVVAALTVLRWLARGHVSMVRSRFLGLALVVLGVMALVTVLSVDPLTSFSGRYRRWTGLVPYAAYIVLGLAAVRHATAAEVDRFRRALLSATGLVVAYALLQLTGNDPFEWRFDFDPFSTLGNSNFASAYVGMTLPLALQELFRNSTVGRRAMWAVFLVAGLVALVGMAAAQGFLVLAVGAALVIGNEAWDRLPGVRRWVAENPRRTLAGVAAVAVLLLVVVLVVIVPRLPALVGVGYDARVYFYDAAFRIIRDNPVLGTGLDTYGNVFTQYQPVGHARQFTHEIPDEVHSVPLGMFVSGGLVLGLAYLAVVAYVGWRIVVGYRQADRGRRWRLTTVASLWLGYQVQSIVSIDEPPLAALHWVTAGLAIGFVDSPDTQTWKLPWVKRGRGKKAARRRSPVTAALTVVVLIAALAGAWVVTRPFRADLAAGYAVAVAAGAADEPRAYPVAYEAFEEAQRLAPWEAAYWFFESEARYAAGDLEGAFRAQARAAELRPGQPLYALNTAQVAAQLENHEAAAEWFLTAVENDPHNPETLLTVARYFVQQGEEERARSLAERVLELDPGAADAQQLLASLDGPSDGG